MKICISNPPYNLKWQQPPYAAMQKRFSRQGVPPENNANFAFVLSGIENCDKAAFILPPSVLKSQNAAEANIRKNLIEDNLIEAVIMCPDGMFEATGISVCIILINKCKSNSYTEFIDARKIYKTEARKQKGQYGKKSHTNRVYEKKVKAFDEVAIKKICCAVNSQATEEGFCKKVNVEEIRQNKYGIAPPEYVEIDFSEETIHRNYADIVKDLNRIIREKNCCKLTINETLAKRLGFDIGLYKNKADFTELNSLLSRQGVEKIVDEGYISFTKNKNEMKFENKDNEFVSSVLTMILQTWKQHIFYLNNEQNRYLAELRDALLPDLMSGKTEV